MKTQFYIVNIALCTIAYLYLPSRVYPQNTLKAIIHTKATGLPSDAATPLACDSRGNIWAQFPEKGLGFFNRKTWTFFDASNGLISDTMDYRFLDKLGNPWFQRPPRWDWSVFDGASWKHLRLPAGVSKSAAYSYLFSQKDGKTWFLCSFDSTWDGIGYFKDGSWTRFTTDNGLANGKIAFAKLDDVINRVWVVYESKGIGYYNGQTWTNFTTKDGIFNDTASGMIFNAKGKTLVWHSLSNYNWDYSRCGFSYYNGLTWRKGSCGYVDNACIDANDDIWFGFQSNYGDNYIARFHDDSLTKFSDTAIVTDAFSVGQFAPAPNGTMWIQYKTSNNGIAFFDGQKFHQFPKYYLGNRDIDYDANGRAWATSNTPITYDLNQYGLALCIDTTWTFLTEQDGLAYIVVNRRVHDKRGNTFVSYGRKGNGGDNHGIGFFNGAAWSNFSTASGLLLDYIMYLSMDSTDHPWVKYGQPGHDSGVGCYYKNTWVNFSTKTGNLPLDELTPVHMSNGETWASFGNSNSGLVQFTTDSLMNLPVNEPKAVPAAHAPVVVIKNGVLFASGIKGSWAGVRIFNLSGRRVFQKVIKLTNENIRLPISGCCKHQLLIVKIEASHQRLTKIFAID
jgi:hypothetical protein